MKKWINTKTILLTAMAIVSLMSILSVGPTYAYLKKIDETPAYNSSSVSPSVNPAVVTESGATKVNVGDTQGYSVYVRAAIVVTWKDSSGNVLGTVPGYQLTGKNAKWRLGGDGYYYYTDPVASQGKTEALFTACTPTGTQPADATFTVDVLAETIQALGKRGNTWAVTEAWGCAVADDSTITPPSAG